MLAKGLVDVLDYRLVSFGPLVYFIVSSAWGIIRRLGEAGHVLRE